MNSQYHEDYMKQPNPFLKSKPRYLLKARNVSMPDYIYYMVFQWQNGIANYIGTLCNGVFKPVNHIGI